MKVEIVAVSESYAEHSYTFISQPYRTTDLSFRVGGPVVEFDVQNGQFFREGELIASIDDRDFRISRQRAEAIYRQAEADYSRISNLHEKGNISGMSYEKAKADYEKARADFEQAENNLEDTRLYAPFDGYVQKVNIDRYQDVKASCPVVTMIDLSRIKVEVYVPETVAASCRNGIESGCTIRFNALGDREFTPEETFLTQSVTDNNISYLLTAVLDNSENLFYGGMTGNMEISCPSLPGGSANVAIPQNAVCHDRNTGSFVWKVDGQGRVSKTAVRLGGLKKNDKVEILSGLTEGDMIAVSNLHNLTDNQIINDRETL